MVPPFGRGLGGGDLGPPFPSPGGFNPRGGGRAGGSEQLVRRESEELLERVSERHPLEHRPSLHEAIATEVLLADGLAKPLQLSLDRLANLS